MLTKYSATLNISERDLSSEKYKLINSLYENSEGWLGYDESFICWFNRDEHKKHIGFSAEMHGLVLSAFMEEDEWKAWLRKFMNEATEKFGFEVIDYEA